jgi:hypothetical protein
MPRAAVVDSRMSDECRRTLETYEYTVIPLPPSPFLASPVSAHPDMLMFIGNARLICEKRYFDDNAETVERIAKIGGLKIDTTDEKASPEYPHDVIFNAAPIGDKLICRKASVSKKIADMYSAENIVNVRQGYAKCSTCAVSERAFITADESVKKALLAQGFEVLKISAGGIELKGYDCGFIGGASGSDGERVYFCGSLDLHPDGEAIKAFCASHGRPAVSLSEAPLYDVGTMFFI